MFDRLPENPSQHEFVTSGSLAVLGLRKSSEPDAVEEQDLDDLTRWFMENVLGGRYCGSGEASGRFFGALRPLMNEALQAAVAAGNVTSTGEAERTEYTLAAGAPANGHAEGVPPDFLYVLRRGFLRFGVSRLGSAEMFRVQRVLAEVAKPTDHLQHYERRMRMNIGTDTALHRYIKALFPFAFDYNGGRYYGSYFLNALGRELATALEREFQWQPKVLANARTGENAGPLSAKQMLLLLALRRIAAPDPIESLVFHSAASLITGVAENRAQSFIWLDLWHHLERTLNADWNALVDGGYAQYRDRTTGAINADGAPHWVELTDAGKAAIDGCYLLKGLCESLEAELIECAVHSLRKTKRENWRQAIAFAHKMHASGSSWSEKDMRDTVPAAARHSLINALFPIIELDRTYFGAGLRYRMSAFGAKVHEALSD